MPCGVVPMLRGMSTDTGFGLRIQRLNIINRTSMRTRGPAYIRRVFSNKKGLCVFMLRCDISKNRSFEID